MRLARLAGVDVAPVGMVQIGNKQALAIERFDRAPSATRRGAWERHSMVSALTVLGLTDMTARYASYEDLAAMIRQSHAYPQVQLAELFSRISFNILCGNTDDHARNTALFWDGTGLRLTPAYDICPQSRTGQIASQAMVIWHEDRSARLSTCLRAAPSFLLGQAEAKAIIDRQIDTILTHYTQVCDEAAMGSVERDSIWGRQFLNPFAFEEWPDSYPLAQVAVASYPER